MATTKQSLEKMENDKYFYACNICESGIDVRYHCTVCEDFDLCFECFRKDEHPHKLVKIDVNLDDKSAPSDPEEYKLYIERKLKIQKCFDTLIHVSECRDGGCLVFACHKMKKIIFHTKDCKEKNKACGICQQVIALCCNHAKSCNDAQCKVPYCSVIKDKLTRQELLQSLENFHLWDEEIDEVNAGAGTSENCVAGNNVSMVNPEENKDLSGAVGPSMSDENMECADIE